MAPNHTSFSALFVSEYDDLGRGGCNIPLGSVTLPRSGKNQNWRIDRFGSYPGEWKHSKGTTNSRKEN